MLLETERINYEQVRGRVSNTELFQLVVADEQFAWLHRISELVVQIDETLSSDQPISLEDVQNLIASTRILIAPSEVGDEFARKYYAALQSEPSVVLAHAAVSELLAIK
ncbi:glyoxalase/bleomycin resistance protein/dioxygenase [Nostoc cycadae WK-1]|nr:glyoxalase/bleomycin resistance protein/dioxygenase [Nostoc cycadae WK-1]